MMRYATKRDGLARLALGAGFVPTNAARDPRTPPGSPAWIRWCGAARVVVAVLALCCGTVVHAEYAVGPVVVGAGGGNGVMVAGSRTVSCTLGQSTEVGHSWANQLGVHLGFWQSVSGGGGMLAAMQLRLTLLNPREGATAALLEWDPVYQATRYYIYRATTPDISTYGPHWQILPANHPYVTVYEGIGDPSLNFYYRGRASNTSTGQSSPPSNVVGEQDFDMPIPCAGASPDGGVLHPRED